MGIYTGRKYQIEDYLMEQEKGIKRSSDKELQTESRTCV